MAYSYNGCHDKVNMDYPALGLNSQLRGGFAANRRRGFVSALEQDVKVEKTPFVNTLVSKGAFQGGFLELKSKDGGTNLISVDPNSGEITFGGDLTAQVVLNIGTAHNATYTGTSALTGTLTSTGIVTGGNFNNINIGTSKSVGGTVNTAKIESPVFNVNANSNALNAIGAMEIQTSGGSALLAIRTGTVTYKFVPEGTIA